MLHRILFFDKNLAETLSTRFIEGLLCKCMSIYINTQTLQYVE